MSHVTGPPGSDPSGGPDCSQATPQGDRRAMGLVLSTAAGLIVSTNLLVAAALLKLLLKRSSHSWALVLNLALADTLLGVGVTGLAAEDFQHGASRSRLDASAPQGKSRCLLRMAFVTSPCMASILSMFLISLDRYAAIKAPLRYSLLSRRGTVGGTLVALLALWVSSITLGFLPGEAGCHGSVGAPGTGCRK